MDNGTAAKPRTAVIGAGSTGIAVAKTLHQHGLPFDCFELGDRVGGNWVFRNSNGMSSSYRSLHINTSRERMEFSDYPMPKSSPDFPRHDHIAAYFDDYVDHFGFRDSIRFGTGVDRVEPLSDGGFEVSSSDGKSERYDAVAVCNGHHWDPRMPEPAFPGADSFEGEQMHSHHYEEESQLAGKRVVILGMGNSAMDIAVDASYHAESTILAARRGAHVVPKYLFGRPIDQIGGSEGIPAGVRYAVMARMVKLAVGQMETYGLPKPDHKFAHAHPTISGRILDRLAHGAISAKPNIAELDGKKVRFSDGSEVEADLVIYCTGYKMTFPFFGEGVVTTGDNEVRLYKRLFHPSIDNLYVMGLVQPLGAIMPIAERQGEMISRHLLGQYGLPGLGTMNQEIDKTRDAMAKRYVASKRHTIQVDYDEYMKDLSKEMETGRGRAVRRPAAPAVLQPVG